jgi:ABC-type uncharacterized transport system substrate-binding protein
LWHRGLGRGRGATSGDSRTNRFLLTGSLAYPETQATIEAFRQGLGEHGYIEGQNIVVEYRAADGMIERLPALATEPTRLKVDLIVARATPGARAAQQATTTIPIVGVSMGDPVRDGLVASLAKPGGNVTVTAGSHALAAAAHRGRYMLLDADPTEILGARTCGKCPTIRG